MDGTGWFLVGAPWDCSGTGRGEASAPRALRRAGLGDLVDVDVGDADTVIDSSRRDEASKVRALPETVAAARALAAALRAGGRPRPTGASSPGRGRRLQPAPRCLRVPAR